MSSKLPQGFGCPAKSRKKSMKGCGGSTGGCWQAKGLGAVGGAAKSLGSLPDIASEVYPQTHSCHAFDVVFVRFSSFWGGLSLRT